MSILAVILRMYKCFQCHFSSYWQGSLEEHTHKNTRTHSQILSLSLYLALRVHIHTITVILV